MTLFRAIELLTRHTKQSRVPLWSARRRLGGGEGPVALANLGRETGARC